MKKNISICIITLTFLIFSIGCSKVNINNSNQSNTTNNKYNNDNSQTTPSKNPSEIPSGDSTNNTKPDDISPSTSSKTKEQLCRIFIFNATTMTPYYVDKNISVTDNALVTALTKELQTNNYGSDFLTLTDKVGIKSAKLAEEKGILSVYFSDSYVKFMTLGTGTEGALLESLVNTYGYNYGVKKVAIYFNNELYTGLKGELSEGYYTTSYDLITKYSSNNSTTSNLENKSCRLYYYDADKDGYYYTDTTLRVVDHALVTALTNALKSAPKDTLLTIPEEAYVSSATLDNSKDILTVDLSKSYYNILQSVGSSSEAGALRSLALTYGYNYGVNKVIIKVDGKNYSGSHILYDSGEYIDISNVESTASPL